MTKYNQHATSTIGMNDTDTALAALDAKLEIARDIVGRTQFDVAHCTQDIVDAARAAAKAISALRSVCEKHRYDLRMQANREA